MNDVWLGDCLELMQNIPAKSVDMILCDLPYGTTACKWDNVIPFEPLWEQYNRVIKDNGAIVLFGSQPFTSMLIMSSTKMFKYCWVWEKSKCSGHLDSKKKPMKQHEDIIVFGNKGFPNYYPQGLVDGKYKNGRNVDMTNKIYSAYGNSGISKKGNYPKSIIKFNNPSTKGHLHPTQKPVALLEYLIKTYTNEGETVLDNCAGSGTTAIACLNTNRNYICIEKEPKYYEIINKRIEAHIKQQNTKLF